MNKAALKIFTVVFCFVIMSLSAFSNLSAKGIPENKPQPDLVQKARFENMLNHNFVYGEDFKDVKAIVNNSVVALLDFRDAEDDSYIAQEVVNSYLFDMYGFTVDNLSEINSEFGQKEGYLYILPRGYSLYEHKVTSVAENEDGTFKCISTVAVKTHDATSEVLTAETLFVKNSESAFGYNIVYSNIN